MLERSLAKIWLMGGVIGCCCCCVVVVTLINRSEVVAINYGFPLIILSSSFGVIKNALNAKQMNTIPPTMVTRFSKREYLIIYCCKMNATYCNIFFVCHFCMGNYRSERRYVGQSFGRQSQPIQCTAHGPTHHQL